MKGDLKLKKRIISALLVLVMLFSVSCNDNGGNGGSGTGDPKPNTGNGLIVGGKTDYVITYPDYTDNTTFKAYQALTKSITEKTGVTLKSGSDFYPASKPESIPKCEILVGYTNRDVTEEYASKISKNRDWLIARNGTKILILGKECIADAVDYFVKNYVVDGNITIADGELYVHTDTYTVASLVLGNKNIADCTIYYAGGQTIKLAAEAFVALVATSSGDVVTAQNKKFDGNINEGEIWFIRDTTLAPKTVKCSSENGGLAIRCGAIGDFSEALNAINEEFNKEQGANIDLSKISFEKEKSEANMTLADTAYLENLEKKAQEMRNNVLNTKSEYTTTDKVYYFSESGNDSNDGLSESTPKKTLAALNDLFLRGGDVVLFKRGDLFRGTFIAKSGVTYSAYGEGDKPTICASDRNYADASLWQKTSYKNVWVCTLPLNNVGIATFDINEIGNFDSTIGDRMIKGRDGFEGVQSMNKDLQVYSDLDTQKFYIYSEVNPGTRFERIEIGQSVNAISVQGDNVTVRNCVFDWIGGSILVGHAGGNIVGYGNAIEVYGGVDGYKVYNNWIYQIYDTGITHQHSASQSTDIDMKNIEYFNNLIEYTYWAIEYYNMFGRETSNVYVHDNFCRFTGYGWGCKGRATESFMYDFMSRPKKTTNYVTENNIFDRCLGYMICVEYGNAPDGIYTFKNNTYIQPYGAVFAWVDNGVKTPFTPEAKFTLQKVFGEENPNFVFIME